MRIRFALAAAAAILQVSAASQQPPERPFGKGVIEVQVTRLGKSEGIPDVVVTLRGPTATADQVSKLFTPNPSLTAAQRQQVDRYIQDGVAANATPEMLASGAGRLQAQLLGQPAPTALSMAAAQPPPANLTLVTDTDGRVSFSNLPPGRYSILAQRDGYLAAAGGSGQPSTIVIGTVTLKENDDAPATLTLAMMQGVVLGGRVRDPEGSPAVAVIVSAQQKVYQDGRAVLKTVQQSQSDDRGVYRMFWLPPGDYYVSATPRSLGVIASPQDLWIKTYFPGVAEARLAAPVRAAEGAELSVDFAVQAAASTGRISGRIVNPFKDANGKPTVPSSTLHLIPRDPGGFGDNTTSLTFLNTALNRSNGEFEIRGVPPGVYDLLASAPTGVDNSSSTGLLIVGNMTMSRANPLLTTAWGRTRVDMGKEDPFNVTITIKAGFEVKVRVTVDGVPPPSTMTPPPQRGGGPGVANAPIARGVPSSDVIAAASAAANAVAPPQVPMPRVRVGLLQNEIGPPLAVTAASQAAFDPSGLYVFPNVPQGNYRIQVVAVPGEEAYVADMLLGGASIYDDGLVVDGPLPGEIEIAIVSNGGKIQGTVANIESRPAANAVVALVPAETRRQNPALYKTLRTNAAGGFAMSGVAPGLYKLFAWEEVPETAWANAEFLSRYEQLGEAVTVMGGESLNTSLKLIPNNYGR